MIDLHCHLLPGIDDGVSTEEEAVRLSARAARDGITAIAATPHLRSDYPDVVPAELRERVTAVAGAIEAAGLGVEVVPGGEVDVVWAGKASEDELRLVTYGQRGTDLLLETPYAFLSPLFEAIVDDLQGLGLRILLAHPERNRTFQDDPRRLEALVRRGVLLQVGADSLSIAPRRSRSRWLALSLIERGLAHVIASDSHGAKLARGPELSPAIAAVPRAARARAEWMTSDAPTAILAGDPLPAAPAAARNHARRRRPLSLHALRR